MAQANPILEQRVEALEQVSQARVVEQVGDLSERVAGMEQTYATAIPHLATKADLAEASGMLRTDLKEAEGSLRADLKEAEGSLRADLKESEGSLRADLKATEGRLRADQVASEGRLRTEIQKVETNNEKRMRNFLMWLILTAIALGSLIVGMAALILERLPA